MQWFLRLLCVSAVSACINNDGCLHGGICKNGTCECNDVWTGAQCGTLALLPAPVESGFQPDKGRSSTWGAAAIQGDDGRFHLFADVFSNHCRLLSPGLPGDAFRSNSQIVHAVSNSALGPFIVDDSIVQPNIPIPAGNPALARTPDGTYLLFYEGRPLNGSSPTCSPDGDQRCLTGCGTLLNGTGCGINLAYSQNINGPWKIREEVVRPRPSQWDLCDFSNPSALVLSNGTILLAYKTCYHDCTNRGHEPSAFRVGIATARDFQSPFSQPALPILGGSMLEDPVLFRDDTGFHLLFHNMSAPYDQRAGHAWSPNGVDGFMGLGVHPYSYQVPLQNGGVVNCTRREEPKLVMDKSGKPTHLYNACWLADGTSRVVVQEIGKD